MNKRMKSANFVQQIQTAFRCPICKTPMTVVDLKSIVCQQNHTFDFTKSGYINFLTQQTKTKYDKDLFSARKKIIADSPFYERLTEEVVDIIHHHFPSENTGLMIADMGSGEGSHLANLCKKFPQSVGIGIDIAKEGILAASKNYGDLFWAVADIANAPFTHQQFDLLLNILSPANYGEFHRLLKKNGLLIKIIPETNYLEELRNFFYEGEKQSYSNQDTVELFKSHFRIIARKRLTYSVTLDEEQLNSLLFMTPLTWSATEEKRKAFLATGVKEITVDLEILVGAK